MTLETRVRQAEARLFGAHGLDPAERFVELRGGRLRVLSVGDGPPVVLLHGVSLAAAIWAPWVARLPGHRLHLVELPGHGLSDPHTYRVGAVREHTLTLMDDLLDALGLAAATIVGHSLGGMFGLWFAAARPERVASLAALGVPAVALPGTVVRMPLSQLTVPFVGEATLRGPSPRPVYRALLARGLGGVAAVRAGDDLLDVLRLAARRKDNARTIASLMHAIDRFRRPRPESVMTDAELARVVAPVLFCLGTQDPFMTPDAARASIAKLSRAMLHVIDGGHAPWLDDPDGCAAAVLEHLPDYRDRSSTGVGGWIVCSSP